MQVTCNHYTKPSAFTPPEAPTSHLGRHRLVILGQRCLLIEQMQASLLQAYPVVAYAADGTPGAGLHVDTAVVHLLAACVLESVEDLTASAALLDVDATAVADGVAVHGNLPGWVGTLEVVCELPVLH